MVKVLSFLVVISLIAAGSPPIPLQSEEFTTGLVSAAWDGSPANEFSWGSAVSDDGRFVAFSSLASNLIPDDTNAVEDIFVYDRQTGLTERVSIAHNRDQANGASLNPHISADGRYVVFNSAATNLVQTDANGYADVFVFDRQSGTSEIISVSSAGTQGNNSVFGDAPAISPNGRFVSFGSYATNLIDGEQPADEHPDVFWRDRQTGETRCVSVTLSGEQGSEWSSKSDISSDGRFVTFGSWSSSLVPEDVNGYMDVFVRDMQEGVTGLASVNSQGEQGAGDSQYSAISNDGRWVTFTSDAPNLVPGDDNETMDIFLHDRWSGQTSLASLASDGTQGDGASIHADISGNGRFIFYDSIATNLVLDDTNEVMDLFVYDQLLGTTQRASVSSAGEQANDSSRLPSISAEGCVMTFASYAGNLVPDDTNGYQDIFYRLQPCRVQLLLPMVRR